MLCGVVQLNGCCCINVFSFLKVPSSVDVPSAAIVIVVVLPWVQKSGKYREPSITRLK